MNRKTHAWLAVLCLACPALQAQPASKEPQPSPPYVAPVPKSFAWVMKIKPAEAPTNGLQATPVADASPPVVQIKELQYTRLGDLQRVVLVTSDGQSHEYYDFKKFHFVLTSVTGKIFVITDQSPQIDQPPPPPYSYYASGFYGVDWIKPDYYTGIKTYKDTKCFHYGQANSGQSQEAWIDMETQFPVALKQDGQLFEFERHPAPKTLPLPPAYQAAWDKERQARTHFDALKNLR